MKPTFEYVNSILRLDPETGFLYWKVTGRGKQAKKPAGGYDGSKYYRVQIDGYGDVFEQK